ncbi:hypothetical protein UFOVP3_18 [uncultured Caudovirales phage]|uniref:Uncharacterized protein n=1 Tax=uncultured Caudovirales phage TaxID=2100421 RepID=A0A6J5T9J7_9CAUD|nr:hypothetical protein UFOVP3_18 [uncultured Caudovirales phage]
MSKRDPEKFEKKPRDFYATIDPAAVEALKPHLDNPTWFIEPCAGAGDLAKSLTRLEGILVGCAGMCDIEPQGEGVQKVDCLVLDRTDTIFAEHFITNPPFTWKVLQPIMDRLISLLPTWLLLPADYMHNVRMGPYMKQCEKVVSIGRLYWEENKVKGVDNYCWYLFNKDHEGKTEFVGR